MQKKRVKNEEKKIFFEVIACEDVPINGLY